MLHAQGSDEASLERLKAVAAECERAGARVAWCPGDLAKAGVAAELVQKAGASLGPIDAIVHAAGFADKREYESLPREGLERAFAVMAAAFQLSAPHADSPDLIMGRSASVCPLVILLLALPIFAGLFWALRRLAPTRLTLAGAAAGLAAGGWAASIYAFHCTESTAPFIVIWYSLGLALAAGLGAFLGRWLLRW